MKLEIISVEKIEFSGNVNSVILPGKSGKFTVLENHASLITSLTNGVIKYRIENLEHEFPIDSGLCEVNNNQVYVCIEQTKNGDSDAKVK